ncbi:MAG: ATP-dependent endonuclease, partial [Marinilabiliales bacterium]
GDTAQLPPVGLNISPALDKKVLSDYLFEVQAVTLRQVVRQSANSGILVNATAIRERIANDSKGIPSIQIEGFQDIVPLSGNLLIETLTNHYDKDGLNNVLVVCRSNKRANQYNAGIRNQILWREEEISIGDFLMVVKNNYFWLPENENTDFIANGDIVEIIRIKNYEEMYGLRFANVTIRLMDYKELEIDVKIMLDTLTVEAPALTMEKSKAFFYSVAEDYAEIRSKKKRWEKIRENEYFNALQVKFSYAVTCHKAQGGQWNTVFIDQGFINEERADKEYLRWLYTAITRSTQKVYLINFKQDFFPGISLDEYY